MYEIGIDSNNNCRRKIGHVDTSHDQLKSSLYITDADNNPFHVTICMTNCADASTEVAPFLGHSSKSKGESQKVTRTYLDGIYEQTTHPIPEMKEWVHPSGTGVFVTKSGSITKELSPSSLSICGPSARRAKQGG